MKKAFYILTILMLLASCSGKQETDTEKKESSQKALYKLPKWSFWEYQVTRDKKTGIAKFQIFQSNKYSKHPVIMTNTIGRSDGYLWSISNSYLVWDVDAFKNLRVVKLDGQPDDTWTDEQDILGEKRVYVNRIAAVEDIKTPAGLFENCLKIESRCEKSLGHNLWWAPAFGIVRIEFNRTYGLETWLLTSSGIIPKEDINREVKEFLRSHGALTGKELEEKEKR